MLRTISWSFDVRIMCSWYCCDWNSESFTYKPIVYLYFHYFIIKIIYTISATWLTYSVLCIFPDTCLSLRDCVVHLSMIMFVELSVMVYCTCYYVDSWDKFLYSCYLFLLHGIPVTRTFLLFIPVICSIHVYTYIHTTVVYKIWECFLYIYYLYLYYEESYVLIRPCPHMLYYSTNRLGWGDMMID